MRGEKSRNFGKQLCVLPTGREKKREKTYSRSSLAMFIPHIVRVKKSLSGNNVGS